MRTALITLIVLINSSSFGDLINEELIAKKGIRCLKEQYSIFNTKNLKNISDKVNCVEEVKITKDNKIQNLDCPDQPIFNTFLNTQKKYQRSSSCLDKSRNQSPNIYENINCDCVTESLKNDYGDDLEKKNLEFKEKLKQKIQKNIGERFKRKIQTIKNNEILLTEKNKKVRSCFSRNFFKEKFLRLANLKGCASNSKEAIDRIQNMFGNTLGIKINKDSIDETFDNLLNGIKQEASLGQNIKRSVNSCFQDPKEMEKKYIRMKYDENAVNLKASFGSFIKGRDLNSPTLREEFNNYVKESGMDIHPLIKTLTRDNLPAFLKEIDNDRSGKELTLNQLLTGKNKNRWMKFLAMSSKIDCISTADELAQAICTDADLAYDDPTLIETFLEEDQDFKNKNTLGLKNLYCEQKDLHTIDKNGRLLVYKNKLDSNLDPNHLMNNQFKKDITSVIKSLNNNDSKKALDLLEDQFLGKKNSNSYKNNNEQIARFEEAKRIISLSTLNNMKKNTERNIKPTKKGVREIKHFFQGLDRIKNVLQERQEDEIRNVANEVYDIQRPNQSKSEFENLFLKNFKDRRYSRDLTNNLDAYHPNKSDDSIEQSCQSQFETSYCAIQKEFIDRVDTNCIDQIGSIATTEAINKTSPNNNFQSTCSNNNSMSLSDLINTISEKIQLYPSLCKELEKNDYRSDFAQANNSTNMAGMYYESQTGKEDKLFEIASSISTELKPESSSSLPVNSPIAPEQDINIASNQNVTTKAAVNPPEEKSSFLSKFNFFNNSKKDDISKKELESMSNSDLEDEVKGKSDDDLLDYISKLESMINEKKKNIATTKESSSVVNPELEKLKKEIEKLKNKTEIVKAEVSNVENDSTSKNSEPIKSTVLPKHSLKNTSQVKSSSDQTNPQENETISEPDQFTSNSNNPLAPSQTIGNSSAISLSLNEQIDDILRSSDNSGPIEIFLNDQKYMIEIKQNSNGETVCTFEDEKLNELKPDELDKICKQYIETQAKLETVKSETKKKRKTIDKKEDPNPKKNRKIFKVEDLNKVLTN